MMRAVWVGWLCLGLFGCGQVTELNEGWQEMQTQSEQVAQQLAKDWGATPQVGMKVTNGDLTQVVIVVSPSSLQSQQSAKALYEQARATVVAKIGKTPQHLILSFEE